MPSQCVKSGLEPARQASREVGLRQARYQVQHIDIIQTCQANFH